MPKNEECIVPKNIEDFKLRVCEKARKNPVFTDANVNLYWYETYLDAIMYGLINVTFPSKACLGHKHGLRVQGLWDEANRYNDGQDKKFWLSYDCTDLINQITDDEIRNGILAAEIASKSE